MLGRFLLLVAGDHEAAPHEVGRDAEEGGAAGEERGAEEWEDAVELDEEGVEEDAWTAGKENEAYPTDSTWEASKEYPSYQQIDHSKLIPLMVKAIQELEAKVKALEEA